MRESKPPYRVKWHDIAKRQLIEISRRSRFSFAIGRDADILERYLEREGVAAAAELIDIYAEVHTVRLRLIFREASDGTIVILRPIEGTTRKRF